MRNEENVKRVDNLLATNHQISICYISDKLGINREMICPIIFNYLRTRKLCTRVMPKSLTAEHKLPGQSGNRRRIVVIRNMTHQRERAGHIRRMVS